MISTTISNICSSGRVLRLEMRHFTCAGPLLPPSALAHIHPVPYHATLTILHASSTLDPGSFNFPFVSSRCPCPPPLSTQPTCGFSWKTICRSELSRHRCDDPASTLIRSSQSLPYHSVSQALSIQQSRFQSHAACKLKGRHATTHCACHI